MLASDHSLQLHEYAFRPDTGEAGWTRGSR